MKAKALVAQSCRLIAPPWTVARQAPLSLEFSRQEYCSGLPFPSSEDLPHPGIEPQVSALQADFITIWATREYIHTLNVCVYICLSISMQLCHYLCLSVWDLALWISCPCLCLLFLGLLSSLCPDFSDQLPLPVSSYSVSCLCEGCPMR